MAECDKEQKSKKMKVIVEFELDESWEKDCSDEMIWADLLENEFLGMDGVEPKLVKIER